MIQITMQHLHRHWSLETVFFVHNMKIDKLMRLMQVTTIMSVLASGLGRSKRIITNAE